MLTICNVMPRKEVNRATRSLTARRSRQPITTAPRQNQVSVTVLQRLTRGITNAILALAGQASLM